MAGLNLSGSGSALDLGHNGGTVQLSQRQGTVALGLVVGAGAKGDKGDPGTPGPPGIGGSVGINVTAAPYNAKGDGVTNDTAAIQAAIDGATTLGVETVFLPRGVYLLGSPIVPKSGVTLYGPAATIRMSVTNSAIYGEGTSYTDFTVDGITFEGTVNEFPTNPKRGRTTSGAGMQSAIGMNGDLNTSGGGAGQLRNFTMRNCKVRNCSGLPILIRGMRGSVRITNCEFTNNMDVGFTFCEEVIFTGNHVQQSADNGVSLSRGNRKVVCVGNTFDNCCYNGIFLAGFLTDPGPQNFSVTGNVVRNIGQSGIYLDAAPKHGVISGNDIDCNLNRGASDSTTDASCVGIFVGGYPTDNRAAPTDWAQGIAITGNHVRQAARAGVLLQGVRRVSVVGNQISDIGTQFLANGTTAVAAADQTQNIGILLDNPTTNSQVMLALNHITDGRTTPYMNFAIVPVGSATADEYFNTMVGARNAYNLVETGSTRNINWGAVFSQNTKHTAGATAGSNAGSGLIAGFDTNGAAGSSRPNRYLTAGVERWRAGADSTAEGGSNTGTDYTLASNDDAGAFLATVLRLSRKGAVTLGVSGQAVTLPGRVVSAAASVTVAAGAQASAASAAGNGANDTAGTLNATAAASPTAGTLITVTFATAYAGTPHVAITAANQATAACQPYLSARSSTGFTVSANVAPGASASLQLDYHVIG